MSKSLFQKFKQKKKAKKELQELIDMYYIYSPSYKERDLSLYVQKKLRKAGIEFETFENQIYSLKEDKPLLSAHMDQVSVKAITKVEIKKGKIKADGNLGADDKNGVWILLQLIRKYPDDVSFIFSTGEETVTQCDIKDWINANWEFIDKHIPYALVFDRRGKGDIIGEFNEYCTQEFEDDVYACIDSLGFKPTMGVFSDADAISEHLSCVNLSCGFYNAHTEKEYTRIKSLYQGLYAGEKIITSMKQFYKAPEKYYGGRWYRQTGTHGTKDSTGWYYEDDQYHVWFCPMCDAIYLEDYMEDIDDCEFYICSEHKCGAALQYYGECYDYELERLFDGDVPLTTDTAQYEAEETKFCPQCGWYCTTANETCRDCGVALLPCEVDGYRDYHDEMLKEM